MAARRRIFRTSIASVLICIVLAGLLWSAGWGDLNGDGRRDAADVALLLQRLPASNEGSPDHGSLQVHFIDVGQGDAVLILTPQGCTMLIDGGPAAAGGTVLDYLSRMGVSRIDLIVGTHPHEDHIGGLIAVLENLPVGKIIDSGIAHTSQTYEKYLTLIDRQQIPFGIGRAGQKIDLDSSLTLKILHPDSDVKGDDLNHASVVIELRYGELTFLFNGDAEKRAETEMLERGYRPAAAVTVLKVGHHGSSSSTSKEYLKTVAPEIAVISAGEDNSYGHPHKETLERLAAFGVKVYRTDLMGSIAIVTDGKSYTVEEADSTLLPTGFGKG